MRRPTIAPMRRRWSITRVIRSALSGLSSPSQWLVQWANGGAGGAFAGAALTPETAMRNATVWACVKLISETLGTLPLDLYRRQAGGGRREATDHPLYAVLHHRPNRWQTSVEWRELMIAWACLRGVAYSEIKRQAGEVVELIPLNPTRVGVRATDDGEIFYDVVDVFGRARTLPSENMFVLRYACRDLITPVSPIALHRESLELAESCQTHGKTLFSNGTRMQGFVTFPQKQSADQLAAYAKTWRERFQGQQNAHGVGFLDNGAKWEGMSLSADDAQFLQTRQYQRADIASIWRCPLPLIGDLTHATMSNHEQQALQFVVNTVRPWCVRFEQALLRDVMPTWESDLFAEFNVDGLLRGDINARFSAFTKGIQWGFLSPNDVRRWENLDPIEGGDTYIIPANMLPLLLALGNPTAPPPGKEAYVTVNTARRKMGLPDVAEGDQRFVPAAAVEQLAGVAA